MHGRVLGLVALVGLMGCGSTGVVKLEADRYMVSEKNAKVGFVSAAEEKASVYRQANAFCSRLGKEVQTLDLQTTNSGFGRQASATLEFKCIDRK
jgi:KaiC/GvpD/RAD55 family RecA-like ATPase